mgnify:CR=1 FL=1
MTANVAVAVGVNRHVILDKTSLLDADFTKAGKKNTIAGIAGRHHTIEHVRATRAVRHRGQRGAIVGRNAELYDTTLGWRFVNRKLEQQYGVDSMAETAENVAAEFGVLRADQDAFALRSQQRAEAAMTSGVFADEITPVRVPQRKGDPMVVDTDEHPRPGSTLEALEKLRPIVRPDGTITAGNASGINDGACALLLASEPAASRNGLEPMARIVAWAAAGVAPRIMGIGPVPASEKVLALAGMTIDQIDLYGRHVVWSRDPGVPDDAERTLWRELAVDAWSHARSGPVQLNLAFREPLVGRAGELPEPRGPDGFRLSTLGCGGTSTDEGNLEPTRG